MSARIDLKGNNFGDWTVVEYGGMNEIGQSTWKCKCLCGTEKLVVAQSLRNGTSVSCGCRKPLSIAIAKTKHGHSGAGEESRTYRIWKAMNRRCKSKTGNDFKYYASLGITVCARWKSFIKFLDDMGECPDNFSIDRIDPYGNYEPNNCRWASAKTQRHNQRCNTPRT